MEIEGEPWFVLKDVAETLGLAPHSGGYGHHLVRLGDDEFRRLTRASTPMSAMGVLFPGKGGNLHTAVSESGLYKLIMRSDKPVARPFQDWVTREVLPSIRKTGSYALQPGETMPLPAGIAQAFKDGYARAKEELQTRLDAAEREALDWRAAHWQEQQGRLADKTAAEAEVVRLKAKLAEIEKAEAVVDPAQAEAVVGTCHHRISEVVSTLDGVNLNTYQQDLVNLGYLRRDQWTKRLEVPARYRNSLFVIKQDGKGHRIPFATPAGKVKLIQLYHEGKLTMKKAFA